VGYYCRSGQATDDNITRHMRVTCWITKAKDTQSMQGLLLFLGNSGYANAPECYVDTHIACLVNYFYCRLSLLKYSVSHCRVECGTGVHSPCIVS